MPSPKLLDIAHHRNGVAGDPFYVALFTDPEADEGVFVGIVPSHAVEDGRTCPATGTYECYVLKVDALAEGVVTFGENSWRGDHYSKLIRDAALGMYGPPYHRRALRRSSMLSAA